MRQRRATPPPRDLASRATHGIGPKIRGVAAAVVLSITLASGEPALAAAQTGNPAVLSALRKNRGDQAALEIDKPLELRYQRLSQALGTFQRIRNQIKLNDYDAVRITLRTGPGLSSYRKDVREVALNYPDTITQDMSKATTTALERVDQALRDREPAENLLELVADLIDTCQAVVDKLPRD